MKKILLPLICILFIANAFTQTPIPAGNVSGIWTKAGSPYNINGNITVPDGSVLIIDPGVKIIFQGYYYFDVKGALKAAGNVTDTILFTINDTTGFSDTSTFTGCWLGVRFDRITANNDSSIIKYCIFEYANNYKKDWSYNQERGGAVSIDYYSKWRISNSVFRYNQSHYGGGMAIVGALNTVVENCLFYKNATPSYIGGGLYTLGASMKIINNRFFNNYGSYRGGGLSMQSGKSEIIHNFFCNNGSNESGGVAMASTDNYVVGNTIAHNQSGFCPGILFFSGHNYLYNNIIWGLDSDPPTVHQVHLASNGVPYTDFYNNVIQQGISGLDGRPLNGVFENTVDKNPLFVNPTAGAGIAFDALKADWKISQNSSCINMGTTNMNPALLTTKDYDGNPRIRYGTIDIGPHEFGQNILNVSSDITGNTIWAADTVKIFSDITIDSSRLTIMPGVVVQFQGHYKLNIDGTIRALGTSDLPVLFTMKDTIDFYSEATNNGGWGGIKFLYMNWNLATADTSIFSHCVFEYGKNINNDWDDHGGILNVDNFTKIRIDNCTFRKSFNMQGGALFAMRTSLNFTNCSFYDNGGYSGIFSHETCGKITYENCIIANNHSHGWNIHSSETFTNLTNCIVVNNDGLNIFSSGRLELVNSLFYNNYYGLMASLMDLYIINSIVNDHDSIELGTNSAAYISSSDIIGGKSGFKGKDKIISYVNNLDTLPLFINPSAGTGDAYDGLNADWSLINISPCINKGTGSFPGIKIPAVDINNHSRIFSTLPDIGPHEIIGTPPVFTKQPVIASACEGDTVNVDVSVNDTAYYQWQKDGKDITGQNKSRYMITKASSDLDGNYNCIVKNSFGQTESQSVYLSVKTKPGIISEPSINWVNGSKPVEFVLIADGSRPMNYKWYHNKDSIVGANLPSMKIDGFTIANEGKYYCEISNQCGTVTTTPQSIYLVPQICIVTVDSLSGKNIIAWEKTSSAPVKYFKIYREGIAKGFYDSIGMIKSDTFGIFRDTVANSKVQAYWYKITSVDSAGAESPIDLCIPHKTIHMLVTAGYMGGVQLDWDGYFGFPFNTYIIYRKEPDSLLFKKTYEISSSNLTWTDISISENGYEYFVGVKKDTPCDPADLLKAEVGPYTQSLSNIVEYKTAPVNKLTGSEFSLSVYPNPFSEELTLTFSLDKNSDVLIEVINATGQKTAEFSYSNLSAGTQHLKLSAAAMKISESICYIKIVANNKTSVIKCSYVK